MFLKITIVGFWKFKSKMKPYRYELDNLAQIAKTSSKILKSDSLIWTREEDNTMCTSRD